MKEFVEIQNWGFNALVISSIITMLLTVFQGYGFIKQNQKIWKTKSAKSLSAPLFFLFFFYFIAFSFYGWHQNSLAMIFNGLLFLPCIPIVAGVIKFKRLNWIDICALILTAAIVPIMVMIKQKDVFLFALLMINLATLATQPLAMIKNQSCGVVEKKFVIVFLATSAIWFIYSLVLHNWALEIFNLLALALYGAILYLYNKYSKNKTQ